MRAKIELPPAAVTASGTGSESFTIRRATGLITIQFFDDFRNRADVTMDLRTFDHFVTEGNLKRTEFHA